MRQKLAPLDLKTTLNIKMHISDYRHLKNTVIHFKWTIFAFIVISKFKNPNKYEN